MRDLPERLARGERVGARVVLVAAHPDDETLALGSRIHLLSDLRLVHITDGAPRDLVDARRAGYATWEHYAAARRSELTAALEVLGGQAVDCVAYPHPDQEAMRHVAEIVGRLCEDLEGAVAVITHPYEWGHPDHDAAALAVALALQRRAATGRSVPAQYEFPSYHLRNGERRFWSFWHDPTAPETILPLTATQQAEKRRALDRFVSQAYLLRGFRPGDERLRPAPAYDFRAAAPPGAALYDAFGWPMTSVAWMSQAGAVLDAER